MVVTNGALAYIFNVFFLLVYIYFLNIIKYLCKVSYKLCNLPLPLGGGVCVCGEISTPPVGRGDAVAGYGAGPRRVPLRPVH